MKITRLDLDGTGSPEGLVTKILKAEPDLQIPVPIEELARCFDITEIRTLATAGYEGGLITDAEKSEGVILVSAVASSGRRRFTIGHELGHFLIPTHKPIGGQFMCSQEDMRRWTMRDNDTYVRMEVEANRFSALLLMPPPILRIVMGKMNDPDLSHVAKIAGHFNVSKEAAARAYATYHDKTIAIAIVKDGIVLRIYKHVRFPMLGIERGNAVPQNSLYHSSAATGIKNITGIQEVLADLWIKSDWGKRLPMVYEQVVHQQKGFAMILLWAEAEVDEEDAIDEDENRTSKERLRYRQGYHSR